MRWEQRHSQLLVLFGGAIVALVAGVFAWQVSNEPFTAALFVVSIAIFTLLIELRVHLSSIQELITDFAHVREDLSFQERLKELQTQYFRMKESGDKFFVEEGTKTFWRLSKN
jgi:uncharacterized membrane protein (DUF106 family)